MCELSLTSDALHLHHTTGIMAAPAQSSSSAIPQDTPITIKVSVNDSLKKLKLPLRDLGANVLPDKVCKAAWCYSVPLHHPSSQHHHITVY